MIPSIRLNLSPKRLRQLPAQHVALRVHHFQDELLQDRYGQPGVFQRLWHWRNHARAF